ncbi:MAG: GNAT family N-acetyltransferase [Pseudomonadota bacterium]
MDELELPLTQSVAFERTCEKLGVNVLRVSHAGGTCLVQSRRLPVIGAFHLISRGPVLGGESANRILNDIRQRLKGALVVNAADDQTPVGGVKIAKGAEVSSVCLEAPDVMRQRLHQKWRNQLKKSEASPLIILDQPLDPLRHKWFLEAETAQQKSQRYKSYPAGFLLAYAAANKGQARLYTAMLNDRPVAGMLALRHGRMATYQAGVTTPEGRQHCAHNLLLWTMMCDLQRRRTTRLDLGRSDLSPGLAHFKRGCGARTKRLAGSFLYHHWFAPKERPDSQATTTSNVPVEA